MQPASSMPVESRISTETMVCINANIHDVSFNARDCMEIISGLKEREARFYGVPSSDLCGGSVSESEHGREHGHGQDTCSLKQAQAQERRTLLVHWCYKVVDHFGLDRSVVAWAMNLMDRFCERNPSAIKDPKLLKLICAASLRLAIKLDHGKIGWEDIQDETNCHMAAMRALPVLLVSQGQPKQQQQELVKSMALIVQWEEMLLRQLGFHVHPTVPAAFLEEYLDFIPLSGLHLDCRSIKSLTCFMTELAAAEPLLISVPASQVALAALLNALTLKAVSENVQSCPVHDFFARMLVSNEDDFETVTQVQAVLMHAYHNHEQEMTGDTAASKSMAGEEEERGSPSCVANFGQYR
jgi:hypothetical protein